MRPDPSAFALFVRAGSKTEIKVPLGNFEVRYASGQKWYGTTRLFGPDTFRTKVSASIRFYEDGDSVVGQVTGGNLRTESIAASQF